MIDVEQVIADADLVEQLARNGDGDVWSITWHAGDPLEARRSLIDHWGAVQAELRRRGHVIGAEVVRDEQDTEHYATAISQPVEGFE